jgi:hypothetical protein
MRQYEGYFVEATIYMIRSLDPLMIVAKLILSIDGRVPSEDLDVLEN